MVDKNHKFKIEVTRDTVAKTARAKGLTVQEFVRRCASAAGHCFKKAKRMAERFVNGGDIPDCVLPHVNFE